MTEIIDKRIKTLNSVLSNKKDQDAVEKNFLASEGDWKTVSEALKTKLSEETFKKVSFAHSLADWSDDHIEIVKTLVEKPDVNNMRDVALRYNPGKLAAILKPEDVPENIDGDNEDEKKKNFAIALNHKLFNIEPTAVLQRMVDEGEIPIADPSISKGVTRVLSNLPDFNIRTTSVYTAFKQPDAFKEIPEEQRAGVMQEFKHLSLLTAISPIPKAVPVLKNANLTSAFHAAQMPESTFMAKFSSELGEETARQVYTNAINAHIRNEQALMTIHEAIKGTGLAIIDGKQTKEERLKSLQAVANDKAIPLNLETLFGSIDYCECDDCLSVYSPASYFVDILQYLRNNNLDPKVKSEPNDITNTPLENLFRRRPDLACLELTCENTFTVLPYVDLVNEVMESFVVHLDEYSKDPKQTILEVFNVTDETTSELLAQPQHTNYQAYCILKSAVYPFTLPYHQPIDAIRIWLKYMGTSRYELQDTFRTATETCANVVLTEDQQKWLKKLHAEVLDQAVDAEFLGITQEEYIILTREAFWPKDYFDFILKKEPTDDEYRKEIGVRKVHEYYGYDKEADMLELSKIGLTFVKKQFLPRTGIQYVDLVELLKTRFINPGYPQGKALAIMESIRFHYQYLKTKVNPNSPDPFADLIKFLNDKQQVAPPKDVTPNPDLCPQHSVDQCLPKTDFSDWVHCYFKRIGQLIVLESGDGPQLPVEGQLFIQSGPILFNLPNEGSVVNVSGRDVISNTAASDDKLIGSLGRDGKIVVEDDNGTTYIYTVTIEGQVIPPASQNSLLEKFIVNEIQIKDFEGNLIGKIKKSGSNDVLVDVRQKPDEISFKWVVKDTCDLDKVRLKHLDGSPLTVEEYDRMQCFIRLWRKLGWTIDETDKALIGLSASPSVEPTEPDKCDFVGFDAFQDKCIEEKGEDNGGCPDGKEAENCPEIPKIPDISPEFLHQLVAVRKLLDLTGLPLDKLLTFWAEISTVGEKSLYRSLFLTHNLLGIDKIFKPDANGNYLTKPAKISEHMPVLMAALKMKADDVTAVKLPEPDALTLANVSLLYRHSLLAKILHVRVAELAEIFALFEDPFKSAQNTLDLLQDWGNMEDTGFTFRQLNYLIRNHDDSLRPQAPSDKTILQTTKTLYDGLNAIDHDHQDIPEDKKDDATADLIRAKAGLLYEQSVVEQIIGLLEGTTVYTTNVPANLTITLEDSDPLSKKIKYVVQKNAIPPSASLQVIGILTDDEKTQAKALSKDGAWVKAIDRVYKKAVQAFNDLVSDIFPANKLDEAKSNLLAGDINISPDPKDPKATEANTAPKKKFYFLNYFMPFLRAQLSHRLLVDTLSSAASLEKSITDVLLSDILLIGPSKLHAINALEQIHQKPSGSGSDWEGYLIPSADGLYSFFAKSLVDENQPPDILIEGQPISFKIQQEDPSDVWSTDPAQPVPLKSGKLYRLKVMGQPIEGLQWKTATSPKANIPTSALLPDYSTDGTKDVFVKLFKAALLVNGFNLNVDEVNYWQSHSADFDGFDFNDAQLKPWRRMQAYANLRDKLPKTQKSLLDLFAWASKPDDASDLVQQIADVTLWKTAYIERLIAPEHFDLNNPENFRNEVNLVMLQKAMNVADAVETDIDRLFKWANPTSSFWVCHKIAEGIRATLRARYDQEDWEQVVKPLNNQLRENQKQALISYLLVQPDLINWGVVDADSLFEFFLIDVQMDPCMQTSRIKQAISSVQSFIQRSLLGLEDKHGVLVDLDRDRWEKWMQKYRVWEANRKVFLYPENWIKPELRDDKSPFYKELESELLQKDINTQTVTDALKSYVFKVDEVAKLKVVGLFEEQAIDKDGNPVYAKLHVFSRTLNAPYFFYYRYFDVQKSNWYPWEKVQVDIPSYDVEDANGMIIENGTYLIPVVWNKRLLIFFPQFAPKTQVQNTDDSITVAQDQKGLHVPVKKPLKFWEIKMAWSEYRNNKWTQKQVSSESINDPFFYPIFNWNAAVPGPDILALDNFLKLYYQSYWEDSLVPKKTDDKNTINLLKDGIVHISLILDSTQTSVELKAVDKSGHLETIDKLIASKENDDIIFIYPSKNYINTYEFIPRIIATPSQIVIDVYRGKPALGAFQFTGSQLFKDSSLVPTNPVTVDTDFHYKTDTPPQIHSLQAEDSNGPSLFDKEPYFDISKTSVKVHNDGNELNFYHPFAHELLGTLTAGNLEDLFAYYLDNYQKNLFDIGDTYGADPKVKYHELKRSYSLYNWEVSFHAPMLLVDRLLKSQQFDQSLQMCHYVFDPLAKGIDDKRFWNFPPFKIDAKNVLENLFLGLQPNTPDDQITEWRDNPFQPHIVARSRPSAYMKWVAMKYIEILIAYGDYYFRQNTLETIPTAIQYYVMAAHIYGSRGQKIPKRGRIRSQTYYSLLNRWDAFSNAMVELELVFPFSNQPSLSNSSNVNVGLPNIFGFESALYFCIPNNPELIALRDTIDDRLFKIRHCEDIQGVFRNLPLFEPPIEPGLLVQAAAQGLSLSSVLNDLNSPMPNYRFYYLLQKALELCSELKALGNAFLSAKEKGDAEALSQLRAKHESSINNLVMEVRKQQLDEAQKSLDSLQQSRKVPYSRMQYYLKLIGEDLGKAPDDNTDFSELPNQIEQPVDESGLKLIAFEKEEMDKASEAADWQTGIGVVETLASVFHALPTLAGNATPLGVGATVYWGFPHMGNATQATARGLRIYSDHLTYQSTSASRKGSYLRQLQDRVQQANNAGYEVKNIDKQILTQLIRIDISSKEITNQQKQIDNAQEVEEFLRNKYTNQELYLWMDGQIRTLYHQTYTLAYDLAKRAEKTYRFERGLTTSNFIQYGYWDDAYDGLFSGERLYVGLKQLESAHQENRGYDYEITKSVSLRQVNPIAFLELRENGVCEFTLPEVLFDMDYPGHYMRRIKSVALTVPCVVGPYTSLNCTLRLTKHEFRMNPIANDKNDYVADEHFITTNVPITSIAVSTGQNDSGVFELNFRDERYIPFEGAGAISTWRVELPTDFKQFDYETISDVILHLRYTAVEGGDKLKAIATASVKDYIKSVEELSQQEGLFAAFDLKHEFPDEWYKATHPTADAPERILNLKNLNERLPFFTKGQKKVNATDVYLVSSTKIDASISIEGSDQTFIDSKLPLATMKSYVIKDVNLAINSWQLKIKDVKTEDELWLIVRYTM